jgi:hypothetical protein
MRVRVGDHTPGTQEEQRQSLIRDYPVDLPRVERAWANPIYTISARLSFEGNRQGLESSRAFLRGSKNRLPGNLGHD